MQCIAVQSNNSKTFKIIQAFQLCVLNKNELSFFKLCYFVYKYKICTQCTIFLFLSVTKTLRYKSIRIEKEIANHIVNFNSYKLCLSDIFDGQAYWSHTGHNCNWAFSSWCSLQQVSTTIKSGPGFTKGLKEKIVITLREKS